MATNPDLLYQKQREALLPYEDARFNSLLAGVPDYYPTQNDYTLYGCLLRVVAMELARIEYMYSNDLVGLEPQFLTPPDIKRKWAAALFINKSYPTAAQTDIDYRQMLVALLQAYPEGATTQAISDVITAYTGQTVPVIELYKLIGNGVYDDSDRNALLITLDASNATNSDPFSETQSASSLLTLSQNLYSAIDLAKPAHVGLDFSITFGSGEDLSTKILAIEDVLEIIYNGVELAPLPPIFTQAPFEDPTSPDTRLTAIGKLVGDLFTPHITAAQYAALQTDAFRAEYSLNPDGSYTLLPTAASDVVLEDASGNPTGAISQAQGVLAPQLNTAWEIKSDEVVIFRMS